MRLPNQSLWGRKGLDLNPCFLETTEWTNMQGFLVLAFPPNVDLQLKRSEDGERRRNILPFNSFSGLEAVAISADVLCKVSHRTSLSNCSNQGHALGYRVFYKTRRSSRLPWAADLHGSCSATISAPAPGRWWDEGCLLLCVHLFLSRSRSSCHQRDGVLCLTKACWINACDSGNPN